MGTPLKSLSLKNVSNPAVMIHNFIVSYCGNALVVKPLMEFNMKHVIQIVFPHSMLIIANLGRVPLFGIGRRLPKHKTLVHLVINAIIYRLHYAEVTINTKYFFLNMHELP